MTSENQTEAQLLKRLRGIGSVGSVLCFIGMNLAVVAVLGVWAMLILAKKGTINLDFGMVQYDRLAVETMAMPIRVLLMLGALVAGACGFYLLRLMRGIFQSFKQGEVLTRQTARRVLVLGCVWFGIAVLGMDGPGLLTGLFLMAFGWALDLAALLREEHDLTI